MNENETDNDAQQIQNHRANFDRFSTYRHGVTAQTSANLVGATNDETFTEPTQIDSGGNSGLRSLADERRVDSVVDPVLAKPDSVGLPQSDSSNATNATTGKCHTSNATNATMQPEEVKAVAVTQNPVVAVPNEWGKLWRIEKNGRYYVYRLRFHPDRITKPGGKITAAIEAKCHNRKGKGRHKESREEATRLRSRAFDIAVRL